MRLFLTLIYCGILFGAFAQESVNTKYTQAEALLKLDKIEEAYKLFKELKSEVKESDTLNTFIVWYYISTATELEKTARMNENFSKSLAFGYEALKLIQQNKALFDEQFATREYWMTKNLIVSNFGLGKLEEAKLLKETLYTAYKNKTLPKGIDDYFNFDFFKLDGKNIWGYEWYPELPDDRFSSSFTKIVYYVYSTKPDGSDKEQLHRFHVLMFHQDNKDTKFDYVLEKQQDTASVSISGTYYRYTYKKEIDYKKLKEDIKEIVRGDIIPDTRRTIRKNN